MPDVDYDIVIVGGSLGGVAAALSAGQVGATVCLLEASGWLGGQYTSQGVSKPDENRFIDPVGSTRSYQAFKHAVRLYYRQNYHLSPSGAVQPSFNPGGPYPGFSLAPRDGHAVLLQGLTANPNIHVRLNTTVTTVEMAGDAVAAVQVDSTGGPARYTASYFLDATDLGELLPQCGVEGADWVLGAESQAETTEPDAPPEPHRDWIQPITMPIALERRPAGEDNTIARPANYDELKAQQNYTILDGFIKGMFIPGKDMWSYRRFIAAANFADPTLPYDLSVMNTASNDYKMQTLPTGTPQGDADVIAAAREASVGYCYWLQTECPHDDGSGNTGYPQLRVRPDVFGTADGTSAAPYIRESRRIKALRTILEQDIDARFNPGPRAKNFADSCGIGLYGIDVHANPSVGMQEIWRDAKPYQISLSALIPVRWTNLLPACKNLGVTHLTNGAYRLHPIEWNIGESAGALAAFCVAKGVQPQQVPSDAAQLKAFQHLLLDAGVPIFWWSDIALDSPYFDAVHMLGVNGILSGYDDMSFRPNNPLSAADRQDIEQSVGRALAWPSPNMSRGQAAVWLAQELGL